MKALGPVMFMCAVSAAHARGYVNYSDVDARGWLTLALLACYPFGAYLHLGSLPNGEARKVPTIAWLAGWVVLGALMLATSK